MSATPRRPLSELITRQLMWSLAVGLLALNALMAWVVHSQLHHQTDAILLTLAATEASAHNERSAPHAQSAPHLHPTTVIFPWGEGREVTKYAFVLSERCELIEARVGRARGSRPLALGEQSLCERPASAFFMESVAPNGERLELRAASAVARTSRGQLTFVVGVAHEPLDDALWHVVLLNLLASCVVALGGWWSARRAAWRLTHDLASLERACERLDFGEGEELNELNDLEALLHEALKPSGGAPKELATLTYTLSGLGARLSESLSAQRRLIAEAAHELRTPLTALKGEIEVTLRRERTAQEYQDSLSYLLGDVARLQRLSERLLDSAVAREGALCLQPLALSELIKGGVEAHLSSPSSPKLIIEGHQEGERGALEGLWVEGDLDASLRALSNLTHNALKHAHPSTLTLWVSAEEHTISLTLSDDGAGLPSALKGSLFQPFSRAQHSSGYGLGLSISRALMRRQGGELSVEASSFEGSGAAMTLRWRRAS